ncbi:MAG: hypothetical protein ACOZCL_18820 [Bacillota bacterium]
MSSTEKELLMLIKRIKNRMHAARLINYIIIGLTASLTVGIIIVVISRLVPVYGVYWNVAKICTAGMLSAALYCLFRRPGRVEAAAQADALGLKERTLTAIELLGVSSAFADLEKEDALKNLRKLDYRKGIPIKPKKKYLLTSLILVLILFFSGFIPNPMEEKAKELQKHKEKITAQQKKLDNIIKQLKLDPKLAEKQKQELEKRLDELKKELAAAKTEKDMDKALLKANKKLELLIKDQQELLQSREKVLKTLAANPLTKDLADMLKNTDRDTLKKELDQLAEKLKNLREEELKLLADNFNKLAKELSQNPELAEALSGLASKLSNGEFGDLSSQMSNLGKALEQLMFDEELKDALNHISQQLQNMQSQKSRGQSQGSSGDDGHQGSGSMPGQGNQGQEGQLPNGQGNGADGGAGSGTDMGTENPAAESPGESGIIKKDGSGKKIGEYENIFTSKTLGGEGEKSNLSGEKNDGGNVQQTETNQSKTVRGSSVPYNQVLGQYMKDAFESIDSSDIPPGMRDLVKDYFTSLED